MRRINRIGFRNGMLEVIAFAGARRTGKQNRICLFWECRCDCGKVLPMVAANLWRNQSCGCVRDAATAERMRTHGRTGSRPYIIWQGMKARCYKPDSLSYKYYGARGISVCDRWRTSFSAFLEDMGNPPSPEHTLDRIDPDADYCPKNCRWATQLQQGRNRRDNLILTVNGIEKCAAEWAETQGISAFTIYTRIQRGWSHYDAVFGRSVGGG